jgi:threonine dehydrogenase-like Zn-dependent dehydrogenase
MKAVVWHGVGDIRLDEVKAPKLKEATDAIVRLTASAICGTDLHMIRGTMPGMQPGTILGHEGIGIIEEVGKDVRNLRPGDRVVVPSTIACGTCSYCRAGYYAQCDNANPNGSDAGTAFYGGPKQTGPFDGMQAEYVRVPYAHVNLVRLPEELSDDQAILLSDIFPTGYMGAEYAEITEGDTVVVFGAGPVGQFAIASARLLGAGRVIVVDKHPSRLAMAQSQGAEIINFEEEDPVETIKRLTGKIGCDRAIDAVGIDAEHPHHGPAAKKGKKEAAEQENERDEIAPKQNPDGDLWTPGDAPSQVLQWAVESLAKAGTLSIIGVYSELAKTFPIGAAMNKNLSIQMGNCHHRKYIPMLIPIVQSGIFDPSELLTQTTPLTGVIEAYERFDQREHGWVKVMLQPRK